MAQRIRVLELRSVRGTGGGPEKTILSGAAGANLDLFDITVCYIRDNRDDIFRLDERAKQMGVNYVEVTERHSFDPSVWRQLRQLVHDHRIDIVHAHDYKTDLLAFLLAKRTRIVPLATAHGWAGDSARERFLYHPADKYLLARFPYVVAVSESISAMLRSHGTPADRIVVLLNGIDPTLFRRTDGVRDAVRGKLGYRPEEVVLGAVGRLHRVKRFDLLIEAMAGLIPQQPNIRLAIVGDGELRSELESLVARHGLGAYCRLLGHRDDAVDMYQAFDMFVQSSESEGAPNAVLEAMAMETPIVATDVGGTRELASPGLHALIVPRHDVPAMQGAIEDVIRDPESAGRRAKAARHRVEAELSFSARTGRLEALYAEMIHERDARAAREGTSHA